MTEDIFILDCYSAIFVWIGQQVKSKIRMQALIIAEVYFIVFFNMIDNGVTYYLSWMRITNYTDSLLLIDFSSRPKKKK